MQKALYGETPEDFQIDMKGETKDSSGLEASFYQLKISCPKK